MRQQQHHQLLRLIANSSHGAFLAPSVSSSLRLETSSQHSSLLRPFILLPRASRHERPSLHHHPPTLPHTKPTRPLLRQNHSPALPDASRAVVSQTVHDLHRAGLVLRLADNAAREILRDLEQRTRPRSCCCGGGGGQSDVLGLLRRCLHDELRSVDPRKHAATVQPAGVSAGLGDGVLRSGRVDGLRLGTECLRYAVLVYCVLPEVSWVNFFFIYI